MWLFVITWARVRATQVRAGIMSFVDKSQFEPDCPILHKSFLDNILTSPMRFGFVSDVSPSSDVISLTTLLSSISFELISPNQEQHQPRKWCTPFPLIGSDQIFFFFFATDSPALRRQWWRHHCSFDCNEIELQQKVPDVELRLPNVTPLTECILSLSYWRFPTNWRDLPSNSTPSTCTQDTSQGHDTLHSLTRVISLMPSYTWCSHHTHYKWLQQKVCR